MALDMIDLNRVRNSYNETTASPDITVKVVQMEKAVQALSSWNVFVFSAYNISAGFHFELRPGEIYLQKRSLHYKLIISLL